MEKVNKKKVLFVGDFVTPTGFSQVNKNIVMNLNRRLIDPYSLAVNYRGDPHPFDWPIFPASLGGDLMGYNRIKEFADGNLDGFFILNDPWVIDQYLVRIKESFKKVPPIVVYFPVDAIDLNPKWFRHYDMVTKVCVYTEFAKKEVEKVAPKLNIEIVPHGVDTRIFRKLYQTSRAEIKRQIFPDKEKIDLANSFIVLNANRNQPRKRIDITIQGFSLFAKEKPDNVLLYLHMGIVDTGFDVMELCYRYGIDNRLILTDKSMNIQSIPENELNRIYNACDVGINTSVGEGWGLTAIEHAVTGAPQVLPNHSACAELYADCGILMPINTYLTNTAILTIGGYVHPIAVADALERLYNDKDLYNELSVASYEKFTAPEYSWKNIVKDQWMPIFREAYEI